MWIGKFISKELIYSAINISSKIFRTILSPLSSYFYNFKGTKPTINRIIFTGFWSSQEMDHWRFKQYEFPAIWVQILQGKTTDTAIYLLFNLSCITSVPNHACVKHAKWYMNALMLYRCLKFRFQYISNLKSPFPWPEINTNFATVMHCIFRNKYMIS